MSLAELEKGEIAYEKEIERPSGVLAVCDPAGRREYDGDGGGL